MLTSRPAQLDGIDEATHQLMILASSDFYRVGMIPGYIVRDLYVEKQRNSICITIHFHFICSFGGKGFIFLLLNIFG